jgi:peptidoglycan hydrolase-like protein with peptidoglycan-binding domain
MAGKPGGTNAMKNRAFMGLAALLLTATPAQAGTAPHGCGGGVPEQIQAAYVRTAQTELNINGYDAGRPDGQASLKTQAAVRDYQRDAQLPVDGCVTKLLLDHLQFVLPKVEKARSARAKPAVLEAQTLLTRRGYYLGPVDGVAGSRTRDAARRFQEAAKLPVTGMADQALVDALKSADPLIRGDMEPTAAKP